MLKFNVSPELREQIVNIIDDFVDRIAPGYLLPNPHFPFDYRMAIYEHVYKNLWREFGKRRSEDVNYRDEVFDFLREVPSEKIFTATELLLKVVCRIVYIQITIPDNFALNPHGGENLWSRKESVRDRHIKLFKDLVDDINDRILKNNSKCLYSLKGESVQLIRLNTGLDVPEEESGIQENDDKQNPELHQKKQESDIPANDDKPPKKLHQNQNRSEFWNRRNYRIAVVGVIIAVLVLCFGEGILIPPLRWLWNHLPTILNR